MQKRREGSENTKRAILETAEKTFAEKGFDGARVDEIARKAGVNKALIYYYFNSKEELLQETIKQIIEDTLVFRRKMWEQKGDLFSQIDKPEVLEKAFEGQMEDYFSFFRDRSDIYQIILFELFKLEPKGEKILHDLLNDLLGDVEKRLEWMGIELDDKEYLRTVVFFFGLLPIMAFYSMQKKWANQLDLSPEQVEEKFIKASVNVYVGYFLNKKKKKE